MAAHHVSILVFIVVLLFILHEELPFLEASVIDALVVVAIVVLLFDVVVRQVASPASCDNLLVFVSLMVVRHSRLQSASRMLRLLALCLKVLFIVVVLAVLGRALELLGVDALEKSRLKALSVQVLLLVRVELVRRGLI